MSEREEGRERGSLHEGLSSTKSNKFYKAIYTVRDKPYQTERIYRTTGMACAVNVGRQDETTASSVCLVTWCGVNCNESVMMDRFSQNHPRKYRLSTSNVKTSGCFSIVSMNGGDGEVDWLKDNKKFKSLGLKVLNSEEQKSHFKVYSISGEEKFLELPFTYNQVTNKHELSNTKELHNLNLLGSPIVIDEKDQKFVVGVVGKTGSDLILCFITEKEIGEYYTLLCFGYEIYCVWKADTSVQYVAQFSYGPSFRTKRTLFDYFRRSFKSSSTEEFQK